MRISYQLITDIAEQVSAGDIARINENTFAVEVNGIAYQLHAQLRSEATL